MSNAEILSLKESAEERRRLIRDPSDLVRCLTIKFEIEPGLGSTVVPVAKSLSSLLPKRCLASAIRLMVTLTRCVCRAIPRFFAITLAEVMTPLAMRPGPPPSRLQRQRSDRLWQCACRHTSSCDR